jgi:hypothetical protein
LARDLKEFLAKQPQGTKDKPVTDGEIDEWMRLSHSGKTPEEITEFVQTRLMLATQRKLWIDALKKDALKKDSQGGDKTNGAGQGSHPK